MALKFLYSLIMIVHSDTEDFLRSLLSYHKLIQVLLENSGSHAGYADVGCIVERAFGGPRLVVTGESLTREVGTMEATIV